MHCASFLLVWLGAGYFIYLDCLALFALAALYCASISWRQASINASTTSCKSANGLLGAASIIRPMVPARMGVEADELEGVEGELLLEASSKALNGGAQCT